MTNFSSPAGARSSEMIIRTLLDLLRNKESSVTGCIAYDFDMDDEGWVPVRDIVEILSDEIPGCKMTVPRLIALVRSDRHRRMQL